MKILHYPNSILQKRTFPVTLFDEILFKEIEEMFKVMKKENGIGLAANQVGLDKSIFIIQIPFIEEELIRVLINPKLNLSGDIISIKEGCLSFPGINVEVPRFSSCQITYQDMEGNKKEEVFTGLPAIVCQHENDHLLGRTFIDDLSFLTKQEIRNKLTGDEKTKK